MSEMREYVVTLKNKEDLEEFYHDMETPGGDLYIPDRTVDLAERRAISRNTHYILNDEEANQLRNDSRVEAVELHVKYLPINITPSYIQTETTWSKSSTNSNTHKNWGLLRCVNAQQILNWGSDYSSQRSGTIQVNAEGRNVDVVIVDGHLNNHLEFDSRRIQYNWFQHNPTVRGTSAGTYSYASTVQSTNDDNHGTHVAGTVAGNTQGWARKANIYNISPYSTNPNYSLFAGNTWVYYLFDYVRAFHNSKAINPATGRRNPTITNNSWGFSAGLNVFDIAYISYRGSLIFSPSAAVLASLGVLVYNGVAYLPARVASVDADIQDAINDGIIMVGAAGNEYTKNDVSGGSDYNNFVVDYGAYSYYYHRGSTPGSGASTICVGAVGPTVNETKGTFSNCGPRVDIFAPGQNIMSAIRTVTSSFPGTTDPRSASFYIGKNTGTSMASPQVAGVLACALEMYPRMTHAQAVEYIKHYAKLNQMTDTGGSYTDYTSLQGATNRYLAYYKERRDTGQVYPRNNYWLRGSSGSVFPRSRKRQSTPR